MPPTENIHLPQHTLARIARKLLQKKAMSDTPDNVVDDVSCSRYPNATGTGAAAAIMDQPSGVAGVGVPVMAEAPVNLGEQLRQAIRRSGLTRNQIARRSGLSYSLVHGFVAKTKDLQLESASRIASVVGIEFHDVKQAPSKQRRQSTR